jgi:hypothetical protein
MDLKKKTVIEAYQKAFGNVSIACKGGDISRFTFYDWLKKDPEFKAAIEALEPEEIFLDFVENALTQKIAKGDTTAIIFALKTKGRKRGYQERTEVTGAEGKDLIPKIIIEIIGGTKDKGE